MSAPLRTSIRKSSNRLTLIKADRRIPRGNWGVDLQAGSEFGYKLLFVVLLAGIFAIFMQVSAPTTRGSYMADLHPQTQASRLGCVTGLGESLDERVDRKSITEPIADLASHCRLLLHDRPKHKMLWRWVVLYPLYVLAEIAIISTDLAELLGSAIALCMLFPALPLWAGVLLTAADVLLLLAFRDPLRGRPVRLFELFIAVLVRIIIY